MADNTHYPKGRSDDGKQPVIRAKKRVLNIEHPFKKKLFEGPFLFGVAFNEFFDGHSLHQNREESYTVSDSYNQFCNIFRNLACKGKCQCN